MVLFNGILFVVAIGMAIMKAGCESYIYGVALGSTAALFLYQSMFKNTFNKIIKGPGIAALTILKVISIICCILIDSTNYLLGWIDSFLMMFLFQVWYDHLLYIKYPIEN